MEGNKPINKISAFFPAYNEEENIADCIDSAKKALEKYAKNWEILIIVYEGTIDRTKEIVKEYEKRDKRVKLIIQPKQRKGVGSAYLIGFEAAKYNMVFYADSDNQFDIDEIKRFLPYIDEYDIITGYRIDRQDAKGRIWASGIYNILMRLLFPIKEKDIDCAFRLVKKKIFDKIKITATTGVMTGEMLGRARIAGYKITQVGVTHYPRVAGKARFEMPAGLNVPKPKVVLETIKEVLALRKELKRDIKKFSYRERQRDLSIIKLTKRVGNTMLILYNAVLLRRCPICKSKIVPGKHARELNQVGICINKECGWGKYGL